MKKTAAASALLVAVLVLSAPLQAAGKYYKWVDEKGVTHYTLSPPPDGRASQEVRTWNSASSDQAEALQRLEDRREAAAAAAQEEQEPPAEEGREDGKKDNDEFAKRCEQHRANLKVLEEQPMVRRQDPETGEMVALDAQARENLLQQTRDALEGCP